MGVHQDELRLRPKEAYDTIATHLGLDPFPANTKFQRYHAWFGHRTELCRNTSLVAALKDRLASEYAFLEELFPYNDVRTSRCERLEDLGRSPETCSFSQREPCDDK